MKTFLTVIFYFLSLNAWAHPIEGDYDLIKGPQSCPSGTIQILNDKLLFGSRHVWDIAGSGDTKKEEVEDGCQYLTRFKKSDSQFTFFTQRVSCPTPSHNGETSESLTLKKNKLFYALSSVDQDKKKTTLKCEYKKSVKK